MESYIIGEKTLAVVGLDYHSSQIIESEREFIVFQNWHDILEKSCLYYSSSFQGRIDASKFLLNKDYKLPIMLSEIGSLIFFPVGNQTNYNCVWISLKSLESYFILTGKVKLSFTSDRVLFISSGKEAFENQLLKAYNLEKVFISRHKKMLKS